MNQNTCNFSYQIGGSLANESPSYVVRMADMELIQALERGEFCYVLNSRQMGKSSLRVRTMEKLQGQGTICIAIDLTGMGTQDLTPEKWYAGILRSIVSSCKLKFNWRSWWREKRDLFSPVQRLALFIEEVLLVETEEKIVIFIDEIDRVLSQEFSLDDFFGLMHSCYQKRQVNKDYHRLTFTLLGVAAPRDLIRDRDKSPFEVGKAIKLRGFTLAEAQNLSQGFTGVTNPQQVLAEILNWTGGQPFLTQKLCQLVAETEDKTNPNLVLDIIDRHIIHNWEIQDEPEHLRTIRDRLCYRDSTKTIRLLGLYQDILEQKEVAIDSSPTQIELRLSGLVIEHNGVLKLSNHIYARVFDRPWIDEQLAKLRPYSKAIALWIDSNYSDRTCLLQGQELQSALTWSLNKSLANVDYQFLVASQDLAKQKVEDTLAAVETASNLLASARKKARRKARQQKPKKSQLTAIALSMTILTILLRYTGILQSWEWNLLDRFFRWRLADNKEPRITVVTIGEADLKTAGQWPISDRTLAQTVKNIERLQPQAIAIDIYRDSSVPENRQLLQLLKANPNIYIVEKAIGDRVLPPAIAQQQVGFSDVVLDGDGRIRRALLSVVGDDRQLRLSLGTQLALNYLQAKNIEIKPIDSSRNSLGKATFVSFKPDDGGYVRADSGGYQVLLNYWGTQDNFQQYSLTQVLNKRIEANNIRDRLILIGTTAESLKDSFYTPYSRGWFKSPSKMPGVFIHANVASQILNAALDNRPLLRTHSQAIESVWILLWGGTSIIIVWRFNSVRAIILTIASANFALIILCYLAFLSGWWLPLIPSLLTLNAIAVAIIIIANRQRDRFRFQHILTLLSQEPNPVVRSIALEYYKQSESGENRMAIEQNVYQLTMDS